jgi:hypothetical protein
MTDAESPLSVFESAALVSLRPGDVVLFRCQQILSAANYDHVIAMLNEVFPDHESVILDNGADIAVLRPPLPKVPRAFRSVARGA